MSKQRYKKLRSTRVKLPPTIRVKYCPTCHFDSHSNSSSMKCPFNERYVGIDKEKMLCNSCKGTDHCNRRSHLCKYYRIPPALSTPDNIKKEEKEAHTAE